MTSSTNGQWWKDERVLNLSEYDEFTQPSFRIAPFDLCADVDMTTVIIDPDVRTIEFEDTYKTSTEIKAFANKIFDWLEEGQRKNIDRRLRLDIPGLQTSTEILRDFYIPHRDIFTHSGLPPPPSFFVAGDYVDVIGEKIVEFENLACYISLCFPSINQRIIVKNGGRRLKAENRITMPLSREWRVR